MLILCCEYNGDTNREFPCYLACSLMLSSGKAAYLRRLALSKAAYLRRLAQSKTA